MMTAGSCGETQATRAARFWDALYTQHPATAATASQEGGDDDERDLQPERKHRQRNSSDDCGEDAKDVPGLDKCSGTVAHNDWIASPEAVLRALLPELPQTLSHVSSLPSSAAAMASVVSTSFPPRPFRILELGCGISGLATALAAAIPTAEVTGVDISEAAVEEATRRLRLVEQSVRSRIEYVVGNVCELDVTRFPSHSFDLIVDKGTSDTLLFRGRRSDRDALITKLRGEIRRLLTLPTTPGADSSATAANGSIGGGFYGIVTPRKRIPTVHPKNLCGASVAEQAHRLAVSGWRVRSLQLVEDMAMGSSASRGDDEVPYQLGVCDRDQHDDQQQDTRLVGKRRRPWLHLCVAQPCQPADGPPPAPPSCASLAKEFCPACETCRWPRYRSGISWNKHLKFCGK
eukprot:Hpha_TRINITY_DN34225_c0_g1::TRINITY_DN34225_c0_g1_i1::g.34332::m.34332